MVNCTPISSPVHSTNGKGVQDNPDTIEALGLLSEEGVDKGKQTRQLETTDLKSGCLLQSVNHQQSILHLIMFWLMMRESQRTFKKKRLIKITIVG